MLNDMADNTLNLSWFLLEEIGKNEHQQDISFLLKYNNNIKVKKKIFNHNTGILF